MAARFGLPHARRLQEYRIWDSYFTPSHSHPGRDGSSRLVADIERSLQSSDLGLNPSSDGNVIRLAFPPLNEERRHELIKVVRHFAEEGRVAVRNVRRHIKDDIEALDGEVSEDDIRRGEHELQQITDNHTSRIDEFLEHKEAELLEV